MYVWVDLKTKLDSAPIMCVVDYVLTSYVVRICDSGELVLYLPKEIKEIIIGTIYEDEHIVVRR